MSSSPRPHSDCIYRRPATVLEAGRGSRRRPRVPPRWTTRALFDRQYAQPAGVLPAAGQRRAGLTASSSWTACWRPSSRRRPDRSVMNSVVYEDAGGARAGAARAGGDLRGRGRPGLDGLGTRTTTPRRPALLAERGPRARRRPEAMAMELGALEAPRADRPRPRPRGRRRDRRRASTTSPTPTAATHFERVAAHRSVAALLRRAQSTGARCAARRVTTTTATSR